MTDACERAALVAAIRADPDDDTLRLAFADWLQDRGADGGAEFIRVQVALGRLWKPTNATVEEYCRLLFRSEVLRTRMEAHWRHRFGMGVQTGRGMLEAVACRAGDWLTHGDAVYAEHPVTRVTLTSLPDPFEYRSVPRGDTLDFEWCVAGRLVPLEELDSRNGTRYQETAIEMALETRWPGVKFKMPNWVFVDYAPWDLQAAGMAGERAGYQREMGALAKLFAKAFPE